MSDYSTKELRQDAVTIERLQELVAAAKVQKESDGLTGSLVEEARQLQYQPAPDEFLLTESGAAALLVRNYGRVLRFTAGRGWLFWEGTRWSAAGAENYARRYARVIGAYYLLRALEATGNTGGRCLSVARRVFSAKGIDGVLKEASSMPPVAAYDSDFDRDPWLLNTPTGTLDLRTGEIRKHNPDDLLTRCTRAPYLPTAQAPRWRRFLREVFCDDEDTIAFMRRWLGYCLTGDMSEQRYVVAWGGGANGKSTLFHAVRHVLGDYADDISTDALTLRNHAGQANPDIARLPGVRLAIAPEWDDALRADETLLKSITGGDPISARYLYRNTFTFNPTCKLVIFGNAKPVLRGTDAGTWRRPILVPFTREFRGEKADKTLAQTLQEEAAGILADLVAACLDWQRQGLAVPERLDAATRRWREECDDVTQFIDACCIKQPQAKARIGELHRAYQEWGGSLRTTKAFSIALRTLGYTMQREASGNHVVGVGLLT